MIYRSSSRSTLVMPTCKQSYEGECTSKVSTQKVSVLSVSGSTEQRNSMLGGLELKGSVSAKPLVGKVFSSAGSCTYPGSSIESHAHVAEEKIGVLLLNLGGPDTLQDVQPFLFNLFADPVCCAFGVVLFYINNYDTKLILY